MAVIGLEEMLECGVHFGHKTNHWNPKMAPYISEERNGVHIIDLVQTAQLMDEACDRVRQWAQEGKKFLFVGTKRQAAGIIAQEAGRCGGFYVNQRWLGGMLTNWVTIETRVDRLKELESREESGQLDYLPKKEAAVLRRELGKLRKYLGGLKGMRRVPDVVIIIDQRREYNAVNECRKLGIPIVSLLDTNCDPDLADIHIPANDDSIRAIKLIVGKLADAIDEGRSTFKVVDEPDIDDIPPPPTIPDPGIPDRTPDLPELPKKSPPKDEKIEVRINNVIENNPELSQLKKIKSEANSEKWDELIRWLTQKGKKYISRAFDPLADLWCQVDFKRARKDVEELKKKYPDKSKEERANILIGNTCFEVVESSYIEDAPEEIQKKIKTVISVVGKRKIKSITQQCAELVYKIAGLYDFELEDPMRQFEALATFGIAWLGKRAIDAGIGWLGVGGFAANAIEALSKVLMIFAAGNCARLFYEAKAKENNILENSTAFEEVAKDNESSDLYDVKNEEDLIPIFDRFATIKSEKENKTKQKPSKSLPPKPDNRTDSNPNKYQPPYKKPPYEEYDWLENLLKNGEWKAADEETKRLVLKAANRTARGWFESDEAAMSIPAKDLSSIDRLWTKYSGDRFGFSVQKYIYERCGGTDKYDEAIWLEFAERVGWRKGQDWLDIEFDIGAPFSHLPVLGGRWVMGDLYGSRLRLLLTRDDL